MTVNVRYPRLLVSRNKILENAARVVERCARSGISLTGVAKGVCAREPVVRAMAEGGCAELGDSRIDNLASIRTMNLGLPLLLLRIPMPSEISLVVRIADRTLVSMAETVSVIDRECRAAGKTHEVVVMADLGDLREGVWMGRMEKIAAALKASPRVRCVGVGVNFGCFGGVLPVPEKLEQLLSIGKELERSLEYPLPVYSGGSTSSLALLENGTMPAGINNLRVGEAILIGADVTGSRDIPWLHQRTVCLEAEVIEAYRKPSVPVGPLGLDAFGGAPVFEDRGERLRAIAAVGRQDVRIEGLTPELSGAVILGGSSDHTIIDVEHVRPEPALGDIMRFFPDYGALLALSTSPYVAFDVV